MLPTFTGSIHPIMGSIKSTGVRCVFGQQPPAQKTLPFVTISRQAGAGGRTLAQQLVTRLNEHLDPLDQLWQAYDRELVEKVAADAKISADLIASLEDSSHTWLDEFFSGLSFKPTPSEMAIVHRIANTIRGLANTGHVILVGRGAGFITANMPAGIHVRLVANFDYRVKAMSYQWKVNKQEAERRLHEIDQNRQAFYKRFFPNKELTPENFTITFNVERISEEQMAECLIPLLKTPQNVRQPTISFGS